MKKKENPSHQVIRNNLLELDFSDFTKEEEKEARDIIINFGKILKESPYYESNNDNK